MAEVRDILDYSTIYGDADVERVRKLHEKVGDFRERFLEDHVLQDLLIREGYEIDEDERSQSYHDVGNGIYNRLKTSILLLSLNSLIEVTSKPRIYAPSSTPLVILPGEEVDETWRTSEGYDALRVEELQTQTLENPEVMKTVREFQNTLEKAFDEYNMQFILGAMHTSTRHFISMDWEDVIKLQDEIKEVMDRKSLGVLDNAYYNMGNRFFRTCGPLYEKLESDELGRIFVLSQEELAEGMKIAMRRF